MMTSYMAVAGPNETSSPVDMKNRLKQLLWSVGFKRLGM